MIATSATWAFTTAGPATQAAQAAQARIKATADPDTATSIKHVIVVLGENRTFDHVFGTFQPDAGQTVFNLLSQGIMNADGSPGPNFARGKQWEASATTAYSIHPSKTTPYAQLPAINDGTKPDPRFPPLPNGPFDVLAYASTSDSFAEPVNRFFQNWQQIDCDASAATPANPSGCQKDLFPWVEVTAGAGEGAASMGVYSSRKGLSPYFDQLARQYAMSDNFHQAVLGGSAANHLELFYGAPLFFANADGTPGVPPAGFIENPNPRSGTNNGYTSDGYHSGSYTMCADVSQPGAAPIRDYLSALPSRPFHGCYPGEYYLVNNFAPGFFGNGSRAPLSSTDYTIPPTSQPHIGTLLNKHGVSWKYYAGGWAEGSEGVGFCDHCNGFLYSAQTMTSASERTAHLKDLAELYTDIQNGALPAVAFVKPSELYDGHPSDSTWQLFEGFSQTIIEMVQANPTTWADTAIIVTVDEGGGYWDSGYIQPVDFFGDGPRIPFIVVSKASQNIGIVHTYYDHVSIDKFIERNWQLGETISLRSRDNLPNPSADPSNPYAPHNSPAIGDLFELFGK